MGKSAFLNIIKEEGVRGKDGNANVNHVSTANHCQGDKEPTEASCLIPWLVMPGEAYEASAQCLLTWTAMSPGTSPAFPSQESVLLARWWLWDVLTLSWLCHVINLKIDAN